MPSAKKILVTGGAGFIGSHLVDALVSQGCQVRIIDNLSTGKKEHLNPRAEFYCLDICDLKKIKPLFEGQDYVFHLAAQPRIQPSIADPIGSHHVNLSGTLNVLVASRDAKIKKFIYSASSSAYGNQDESPLHENMSPQPMNPYAVQKYMGEIYCKMFFGLYSLPTISLRYFNVFGPRQSGDGAYATVIGIFLRQKNNQEPLTIVGDGHQRRDFTYVGDVVRANLLAMKDNIHHGEVINIGAGRNHSVNDLAKLIGGPAIFIPPWPGEIRETLADNSKAKKLLGWQPEISLEDGLLKC